MAERPILMSGPAVRGILDGHRTQTRRPLRPQPGFESRWEGDRWFVWRDSRGGILQAIMGDPDTSDDAKQAAGFYGDFGDAPYGVPGLPGDLLWVREGFYCDDYRYPNAPHSELIELMEYRASHDCGDWEAGCPCADDEGRSAWRNAMHMPKWASRIWLRVTDVRVERVQEISSQDVQAEGCTGSPLGVEADAILFPSVWNSINAEGGYGWDTNPWVWALTFERCGAPR